MFLHPELDPLGSGYQAMTVQKALTDSRWMGKGSWSEAISPYPFERTVPDWSRDFLLTAVIYKLGWLPFFLLVLAVAGLLLWLLWKSLRQRNQAGRLIALSVVVPLGLQTAFSVAQNLGYMLLSSSMPLVTGNLPTVVAIGLVGLVLSVFREDSSTRIFNTAQGPASRIKLSF